jgi:hypothetical protein
MGNWSLSQNRWVALSPMSGPPVDDAIAEGCIQHRPRPQSSLMRGGRETTPPSRLSFSNSSASLRSEQLVSGLRKDMSTQLMPAIARISLLRPRLVGVQGHHSVRKGSLFVYGHGADARRLRVTRRDKFVTLPEHSDDIGGLLCKALALRHGNAARPESAGLGRAMRRIR